MREDRPVERYRCPECGAGSPSKRWMPVPHADDCPNLPANRAVQDEKKRQALGWWTIAGDALLEALNRAHDGDDPAVVYAELYANSEHERPEDDQ